MLPIPSEYYGDDIRWFIGTVIDNTPPYGMEGKIKIHIDGIHSTDTNDIPHKDLPWAQVLMPTNNGGTSGHGQIPQLLPNSRVFGIFLDGKHSQLPLVLGHLHTTEYPNIVQYKNVLIPDEPIEAAQRVQYASQYFINLGYRPHIAATIVGAADSLSRLDPTYLSGSKYGIMHWDLNTVRFQSFINFSEQFDQRYGPEDFITQLAFIAYELRTSRSEVVGNMRRTHEIDDKPIPTRSNYVAGLGSASMFVGYFDKNYQQEIINSWLKAFRSRGKDILVKLII